MGTHAQQLSRRTLSVFKHGTCPPIPQTGAGAVNRLGRRQPPGLRERTVTCPIRQQGRGPVQQASLPGIGGHRPPILARDREESSVGSTRAPTRHATMLAADLHRLSWERRGTLFKRLIASERKLRKEAEPAQRDSRPVMTVEHVASRGTIGGEARHKRAEGRAWGVATGRIRSLGQTRSVCLQSCRPQDGKPVLQCQAFRATRKEHRAGRGRPSRFYLRAHSTGPVGGAARAL
jgi:hypothetical protein